jgi:hypothetical protein
VRPWPFLLCATFKCVQPIGIEHNWGLEFGYDCVNKFCRAGMPRDSWTDSYYGFVLCKMIKFLKRFFCDASGVGFAERLSHQFGAVRGHCF